MSYLAAQFDEAARNASKIVTYDEERKKAFMEGVMWTIDKLEQDAYQTHHPMASDSDNRYLDKLTMQDLRRFVDKVRGHK